MAHLDLFVLPAIKEVLTMRHQTIITYALSQPVSRASLLLIICLSFV